MKAEILKKEKRYSLTNLKQLNVIGWGEFNDYPQTITELNAASTTASGCISTYVSFIYGNGFLNQQLSELVVNADSTTLDGVLARVVEDYAVFGGFAIHVNFNANYQISDISHVPFENIRLCLPNNDNKITQVAIHSDWGKRNTAIKRWSKDDIDYINVFNIQTVADEVAAAGGLDFYKGQIFYFSNRGKLTYPLPIYDSALTDISTESGIANTTYRNARCSFMPAGMMVVFNNPSAEDDDTQSQEVKSALMNFQGDENAGRLMYMSVGSRDDIPEWLPIDTQNFDKVFDTSRNAVKDSIGRAFQQPPILRAEDVSGGFGASLIKQAYNYYNTHTNKERANVSRAFALIMGNWFEKLPDTQNFIIEPTAYNVYIDDVATLPSEILATLTTDEKRALIGYEPIK